MLKKLPFLCLALLSLNANAYFVTVFKASSINYNAKTHLLVTGVGEDLGEQFQIVAKAKAMKYLEQFPNDQIVLLAREEEIVGDDVKYLEKFGFNLVKKDRSSFDGETFVEEAIKFSQIASLDIFSHSSAQYGIHLDGKANRLTTTTKGLERVRGHFTKDAYAYLHGCNAGFYLAPHLSNVWEIPVAGAMTSTNFQKLHNDGQFYLTEDGYAPNSDWAKTNKFSFNNEEKCKDGTCLRLKPDNHPYVGFWGEYHEGGLPFYKFFCAKNSTEVCQKAMANSLLTFTATTNINKKSNLEDYKKVVMDFLCPISSKRNLREECERNLENSLITNEDTYNPFSRPMVQCDLQKCEAEITCKKIVLTGVYKPGTCELKNNFKGKANTLATEYKAYINGYKYLNQ